MKRLRPSQGWSFNNNPDLVSQPIAIATIYKNDPTTPKSVECPADIAATVGKTFDCHVTSKDGATDTVTLKVEQATSSGQVLPIVGVHKD